MESDTT